MERDGSGLNIAMFLIVLTVVLLFWTLVLDSIEKASYTCSKPKPIVALEKLYILKYCDKDISSEKTECLHNGTEFECYTSPDTTVQYR